MYWKVLSQLAMTGFMVIELTRSTDISVIKYKPIVSLATHVAFSVLVKGISDVWVSSPLMEDQWVN